ncbi:MAG: ATP-binding protein, partial [Rhodocyclaceae bacterium]|nr:ATP-binding protein [Rhodocyclaceae bacterium]
MAAWLPRTLFGRLVLVMMAGLLLAQLLGAVLHLSELRRTVGRTVGLELAQRVASVYRAIDSQTGTERERLAKVLSTTRQQLTLEAIAPQDRDDTAMFPEILDNLSVLLGPGVEVRPVRMPRIGDFVFDLYIRLSAGDWLRIQGNAPTEIFAWPWHLLVNLGVMLGAVIVLVWFAARTTVKPLTDLARAARDLGEDLRRAPLPEDGPSEVRQAAHAFNAMQLRIRHDIEERERFLAAVSHDLKTPVTRLRLRSELLGDTELRQRFLHDLDDMQDLLGGALDFLQGKAVEEAMQPVDLVAMAESLADDFNEAGGIVTLREPESLRVVARPRALRRAFANLIDNALKYGGRADVSLSAANGELLVAIADDGPGLPEGELERVFEPFYRIETSRNRDTGGVGLGLAIVRQIARSHGGTVSLENRAEGGLRAV